MLRVIREVGPNWVVGENVAGILSMDGGRVLAGILADMENAGYSAEIYSIPAIGVGAPHERERVWIVAHSESANDRRKQGVICETDGRQVREMLPEPCGSNCGITPKPASINAESENNKREKSKPQNRQNIRDWIESKNFIITDPNLQRCAKQLPPAKPGFAGFGAGGAYTNTWSEHWLPTATRLCRVDDGIPGGMDRVGDVPGKAQKRKTTGKSHRLEALGNAIVPQIAYQIFQAINEYETQF